MMDLYWIYGDRINDLQGIDSIYELFWLELKWYEEIKVKPFKLTSIETTQDLEYFKTHWDNHIQQIKTYIDKLIDTIDKSDDSDNYLNSIKETRQEFWNNDNSLQQEYPDFDDYWDYVLRNENLDGEISDLMQYEINDIEENFQDVLDILKKENRNYLDRRGLWPEWIDQADKHIKQLVYNLTYNTPDEMVQDFKNNYEEQYWKDWNDSENKLYLKLLLGHTE
jgi:hypothetical protein